MPVALEATVHPFLSRPKVVRKDGSVHFRPKTTSDQISIQQPNAYTSLNPADGGLPLTQSPFLHFT